MEWIECNQSTECKARTRRHSKHSPLAIATAAMASSYLAAIHEMLQPTESANPVMLSFAASAFFELQMSGFTAGAAMLKRLNCVKCVISTIVHCEHGIQIKHNIKK